MIHRLPLLASCAALVVLGGCAPDGSSLSLGVETGAADAAAPVTVDPVDPGGAAGAADPADAPGSPDPVGDEATDDASDQPRSLLMPATATVIGDSIALSAQPVVVAALESLGIDIVHYDAVESRRMVAGRAELPSGATAIEAALAAGPSSELWIIALGTNDVGAMADTESARADIEHLVELVPDDSYLIWVDTSIRDLDDDAVAFNALLRESLASRPATWVLDWHAVAAIETNIVSDGVHLTDVGRREWARMIGDALRAAFDRR